MTPEDMKAIQQNNYNLFAAEMVPILLNALDSSPCTSDDEKAMSVLASVAVSSPKAVTQETSDTKESEGEPKATEEGSESGK